MRSYTLVNEISEESKKYFESIYPKHTAIGFIKAEYEDGTEITSVLLQMKKGYKGWTPTNCYRKVGDHFIKANYSSYTTIYEDMTYTDDTEDR